MAVASANECQIVIKTFSCSQQLQSIFIIGVVFFSFVTFTCSNLTHAIVGLCCCVLIHFSTCVWRAPRRGRRTTIAPRPAKGATPRPTCSSCACSVCCVCAGVGEGVVACVWYQTMAAAERRRSGKKSSPTSLSKYPPPPI